MKHFLGAGLVATTLAVSPMLITTTHALAQATTRTNPTIETLFRQSITAIDQQRYLQATQLLTRLIELPEHVHSQRAQEMLGNVREANGQLAHAVAEYEIYLSKYPTGPGASRVSARLDAILTGAAPEKQEPAIREIVESDQAPARVRPPRSTGQPARVRTSFGRATGSRVVSGVDAPRGKSDSQIIAEGGTVTRTRGSVGAFYTYNEGATTLTQLNPDPAIPDVTEREEDVFNNALTLSLRISRTIEDSQRKVTLSFGGNQTVDFEDDDDNQFRLYEAMVRYEDKPSGQVLTFGRQRIKPSGIAYRLDGLSYSFPLESGVTFGAFVGSTVDSTRDGLFENDAILYGVSVTWPEGLVGPGELSAYLVEQQEDGFTDRRALGLEYRMNFDNGTLFANGEYDLQFGEVNRALVTGTRVLPNSGRLTARLAYFRSPRLQLQNALVGQSATSLDELSLGLTQDEIEDLALARTAEVTTLGVTYYGPINEKWNISAYGSLYDTSGKPATTGLAGADDVAAVSAEGVRAYGGFNFIGSDIFRDRDQLNLGMQFSHSDSSDLIVASASMRMPFGEDWTVRPRIRVGYRDQMDGDEKFVIPSVFARYRMNRQTSLQFEVGGRWSDNTTSTTIRENRQFFFNGGIVRSF